MTAATTTPTNDELLDIGQRMAQELLEFIEAGEEIGHDMTAPRKLLEEWHVLWRRTDRYWQIEILAVNRDTDEIDTL